MLLYLDIDGVMVPANSWRKPEILEDGLRSCNILNLELLDNQFHNDLIFHKLDT